jgi:starch-binding outer membrane protein, SusD/RagB family
MIIMHKISKYTALIVAVLTFLSFSCRKEFLDQKPTSSITELTYYKNVNELETGLDACYAALRNWGIDVCDWMAGDLGSDDADCGSLYTDQPDLYNISYSRQNPSNAFVLNVWWCNYTFIARCNQVIDKSSGAQT